MADNVMKGRRILGESRAPKARVDTKTCAMDGCSTQLSRYNRRDHCYAHAPTKFPRLRGRIVTDG